MPLLLAPLVGMLLWSERQATRMGLVPNLDEGDVYEGLPPGDPVDGRSSPLSPLSNRGRLSLPPPSPRQQRFRSRPRSGMSCTYLAHDGWYTRLTCRTVASSIGTPSWWVRVRRLASALDLPGLVLLAAGVAMLLVPLSLSHTAAHVGHAALLAGGAGLLGAFVWWDLRHAASPVIARPFINNRTVLLAAGIGFFDFVSAANWRVMDGCLQAGRRRFTSRLRTCLASCLS
jgi:hypothetical protein